MKFTDEELSRVLSAHEGGQLKRGGEYWSDDALGEHACVIQAAKEVPSAMVAKYDLGLKCLADRFDTRYRPGWRTDTFLRWLVAQGVA